MKNKKEQLPIISNIYYHSDFDGVIAAALLRSLYNHKISLFPVNYHLKKSWYKYPLLAHSAIVDFLFHPRAEMWFDHHDSTFINERWKNEFTQSSFKVWDPDVPSCPELIQRNLVLPPEILTHFKPYIQWASIIDSANYSNPKQATDLSNPYLLLAKVIENIGDKKKINRLVEKVTTQNINELLEEGWVNQYAEKILQIDKDIQEKFPELVSFNKGVACFDQSFEKWSFQRYRPYLLSPKTKYVVGIYKTQKNFVVSVGSNPWKPSKVDIGLLCSKYGGGGRKTVGGVVALTQFKAKGIAHAICKTLQETSTPRNSFTQPTI